MELRLVICVGHSSLSKPNWASPFLTLCMGVLSCCNRTQCCLYSALRFFLLGIKGSTVTASDQKYTNVYVPRSYRSYSTVPICRTFCSSLFLHLLFLCVPSVQLHSPIHHQRHSPVSQRHSPISQRHSPVPPLPHHSPIQQRRSPVLQRLSPDMHRRSPLLDVNDGPASYSCRPPTQHLRASFQGRRSYSEVADPSAYQCPPRFSLDPVSTLPKPRPYVEGYPKQQPQLVGSPHAGLQHRSSPSPHQGGAGGDVESSIRHSREMPFPLSEVAHLHFEPPPPSTPAPQPPQSSEDEEEWTCPHPISPPRTLGVLSAAVPSGVMRGPASCSAFPIPQRPNTLSCHPQPGYMSAEHAQSWPSINVS